MFGTELEPPNNVTVSFTLPILFHFNQRLQVPTILPLSMESKYGGFVILGPDFTYENSINTLNLLNPGRDGDRARYRERVVVKAEGKSESENGNKNGEGGEVGNDRKIWGSYDRYRWTGVWKMGVHREEEDGRMWVERDESGGAWRWGWWRRWRR
ncbi:hypothetical protein K435DRAFT_856923 [Dendrothele bispora CBS 962.96]|uniref:Uncharacterized protein n=1 Tax=Dendrothele bispora (strain CBS 962.96) TaxID=1314807 RepID=A0A4V4HGB8_DENBC|nr:hypothetical protein K435DRAFT_856923 [Dendrothele bispora CBS 962.96]